MAKLSVDEASGSRINASLPVLALRLEQIPPRWQGWMGFSIEVTNHGVGPALFVKARWYGAAHGKDEPGPTVDVLQSPDFTSLGAGVRETFKFQTEWPQGAPMMSSGGLIIEMGTFRAWYRDVHDQLGEVSRRVVLTNETGPPSIEFARDDSHVYKPPGKKALVYDG